MAQHKYIAFWTEILKEFNGQLDPLKEFEFRLSIDEISEIGNRDNYDGYLEYWAGDVRKLTNSAVFRDLKEAIIKYHKFSKSVFGYAEFRIKKTDLTIAYSPLNFDNILWWYTERVIPEEHFADEKYKWKLVQKFQDSWTAYEKGETSFVDCYKSIDFANLLFHNSRAVLDHVLRDAPDDLEQLIKNLYDESVDLPSRITSYQWDFEKVYKSLKNHGKNTFQEERTIATLLCFRYPDRYTFYKDSFYSILAKGLGIKPQPPGQKLLHYYELVNQFLPELESDEYLMEWIGEKLDSDCYSDEKHFILAQDILYTSLLPASKEDPEVGETGEPINFILVNITWNSNDWKGISEDKSNHAWVKEGGIPHESWNFDFENPRNDDGLVKGYAKFTNPPNVEGNRNLLVFYSDGRIVGFYAKSEVLKETEDINDQESYNLTAPRDFVCLLTNKIDDPKTKGYLEGLSRIGQVGFSYLKHAETIGKILDEAIQLNPNQSDVLTRIKTWASSTSHPTTSSRQDTDMKNTPVNQIFFGPPGTGKTYHTKSEAVRIVEELSSEEFDEKYGDNREAIQKAFNAYKERKQIMFVTFHQSFTYEDFIEGIKPKMSEDKEGDLGFEIVPGVFKEIAENADSYSEYDGTKSSSFPGISEKDFKQASFYKISLGNSQLSEDEEIYRYCIDEGVVALGYGQDYDYTGMSETEVTAKVKDLGIDEFNGRAINYFKNYLKEGNYVIVSHGNKKIRAIGVVKGDYYFDPESPIQYNHFRKVEWLVKDENIPVEEFYKKSLSQQTIYKLNKYSIKDEFFVNDQVSKQKDEKKVQKNHVLIIDEINRGNVAQIFGELITLIEEDKRKDGLEALATVLPYSKEDFTVPSNLYLIGTMNTADRSVEALDTALRRRFSFKEMPPRYNVLPEEIDGIDIVKILSTINGRIELLVDKDHKIGHSYFIGIKSLEELKIAFRDKIIPLLQEYFFGDVGKIGLILGERFIIKNATSSALLPFSGYDEDVREELSEKQLYTLTDISTWDQEAFQSVYK